MGQPIGEVVGSVLEQNCFVGGCRFLTINACEMRTEDWYTDRMTTVQVPTRFDEAQLVLLDQLVTEGLADSRSELIRFAVDQLHSAHRRRRTGQTIADAYREMPQTGAEDTWAMANAIALTEAEPW